VSGVELVDPRTRRSVVISGRAQMHQRCRICGEDLHGHQIASVEGAKTGGCSLGWFHLAHLSAVLMAAPAKKAKEAT
jgi:hypothetical protein